MNTPSHPESFPMLRKSGKWAGKGVAVTALIAEFAALTEGACGARSGLYVDPENFGHGKPVDIPDQDCSVIYHNKGTDAPSVHQEQFDALPLDQQTAVCKAEARRQINLTDNFVVGNESGTKYLANSSVIQCWEPGTTEKLSCDDKKPNIMNFACNGTVIPINISYGDDTSCDLDTDFDACWALTQLVDDPNPGASAYYSGCQPSPFLGALVPCSATQTFTVKGGEGYTNTFDPKYSQKIDAVDGFCDAEAAAVKNGQEQKFDFPKVWAKISEI